MRTFLGLILIAGFSTLGMACNKATAEGLTRAVDQYNKSLRWKRFTQASMFVAPDVRSKFLERYLAAEDDLNIQSLEVRAVHRDVTQDFCGPSFQSSTFDRGCRRGLFTLN